MRRAQGLLSRDKVWRDSFAENRGLLRDRGDARSSPHPSVIALGCLDEGEERGVGQSHSLKVNLPSKNKVLKAS